MGRYIISMLLFMLAIPAIAQESPLTRPWSNLEYRVAANCVWNRQSDLAEKIVASSFSIVGAPRDVQADFSECTNIDGLKGRNWNTGQLAASLADFRYETAIDCFLKNNKPLAAKELDAIVAAAPTSIEKMNGYRLPAKFVSGIKTCDQLVGKWIEQGGFPAAYAILSLRERHVWNEILDAWDADPLKQNDSSRLAGCAWRRNAVGVRQYMVATFYGQDGTKMERLTKFYPVAIGPCVETAKVLKSDPKQVTLEIINLTRYRAQSN